MTQFERFNIEWPPKSFQNNPPYVLNNYTRDHTGGVTERKSTECLDFRYLKLNDLEMTIKVTGKTVVKLVYNDLHTSI